MVKRELRYMPRESQWWRDLMSIGDSIEEGSFLSQVSCKIGNRRFVSFWHASWLGHEPLRVIFQNLYNASVMKGGSVMDMGNFVGEVWMWNLHLGNLDLIGNLLEKYTDLLNLLMEVRLRLGVEDCFDCNGCNSRSFIVNSCYFALQNTGAISDLEIDLKTILDLIWKTKVPLKAHIFCWRLALDRLPTRSNLVSRGIISNVHVIVCVLCFTVMEDNNHLFLSCPHTRLIWRKISEWVGIEWIEGDNVGDHLLSWFLKMMRFNSKSTTCNIWITTCWTIWWTCNQIIFNYAFGNTFDIALRSIHTSWWWLDFWSTTKNKCSYYDWYKSPTDFLQLEILVGIF
ncbi:unnamed protein product [Lathyrus sativus]|nr:unnamed protein product [Lathyrus sativus]